MYNILIVEDDLSLSNGIALALKDQQCCFFQESTLGNGKKLFNSVEFNLLILDVNLPDGNGLDWLKEIRKNSAVPIIVLTANDLETDIVTGLELGADDYITKPFSLMVLRARVNNQLRKEAAAVATEIVIDNYLFSFNKMEYFKDGIAVNLSKTEQKLLKTLIENRGNTIKRGDLVDKVWTDGAEYVDENALSVTIKRLRDKLEENPSKPQYIKTVYGIGYTWVVK
ncbi:MAG: response regulator transcription factor [Clostridiales bacterium]